MGAMSCMLFSSPHWNPTVLDSIDHNPKGNDPLYFSLTAMPNFWHLKIIKAISIESCIEILTSLGRSPPSTNESFLTKFWLSKYFGNNSSVFTAVMGDRMEERGWVFLTCLAFSRGLTPGNWGPQSSDVSPRISQETDIFRPFHFVFSVPWLIISISKCFEAKANRTFKKIFMCHVITVLYVFIGITGTLVIDLYH